MAKHQVYYPPAENINKTPENLNKNGLKFINRNLLNLAAA